MSFATAAKLMMRNEANTFPLHISHSHTGDHEASNSELMKDWATTVVEEVRETLHMNLPNAAEALRRKFGGAWNLLGSQTSQVPRALIITSPLVVCPDCLPLQISPPHAQSSQRRTSSWTPYRTTTFTPRLSHRRSSSRRRVLKSGRLAWQA